MQSSFQTVMCLVEKIIRGFITTEGKNGYREELVISAIEGDEEKGRIL